MAWRWDRMWTSLRDSLTISVKDFRSRLSRSLLLTCMLILYITYRFNVNQEKNRCIGKFHLGEEQAQASGQIKHYLRYNRLAVVSRAYCLNHRYYYESLRLVREAGDPASEMRTYNNIAMALEDLGNLDDTLSYYEQSWELARKLGYRVEESIVLTNMAETYEKLGDLDHAMELNRQALDTIRETGDRAQQGYTLESLASLSLKRGNLESAVNQFRQALTVGQEVQDMQVLWQSRVGLGLALERQGKMAEALEHYAEAIALFDALRTRLGIESLSTGFLDERYEAYPLIVQLLSSNGKIEEAFAYAEKYKSKTLLEILSRARFVVERLLPDDLRAELRDVNSRLEGAHRELALEQSKSEKVRHHVSSLNQKVTELELEKASVDERIQEEYGAYHDLNYAEPLTVEEVRSRILGPNQVLVEYLVGPEKLSIFVVTRDEVRYCDVPISREELIEKLAALSRIFREESGGDDAAGDLIFNPQVADFSLPPAAALYEVLIEPVESWLSTNAELIIVPDDVLFYLPFEVLVIHSPDAAGRYDFDQATFLSRETCDRLCAISEFAGSPTPEITECQERTLGLGEPGLYQG